ncbi:MAG: cupredoxin domain-containing protein, partial [Mariprofundus sp.]|nr:cupredoxin domain-containing protein [Mariprofundus sp.]
MKFNSDIKRGAKTADISLIGSIVMCTMLMAVIPANSAEYEILIKNHRFIPDKIEMGPGEKHRLIVHNDDATPEEFESYELNREKIIPAHSKVVIFLAPLEPGTYPFF